MENDLKIPIIVSVFLHLCVFFALSHKVKKNIYINIPVEMFFYSQASPSASVTPAKGIAAQPEPVIRKEKEIVIPKKTKKEKKKDKIINDKKTEETKPVPQLQAPVQNTGQGVRPLIPTGQISIDAARFPYTYYTNTIVKKIGRNWQWSVDYGRMKCVMSFRIDKNGNVGQVKVHQSSGDNIFDEQAKRAVVVSSPFPPLPEGYNEDDLGVYFEFSFKE